MHLLGAKREQRGVFSATSSTLFICFVPYYTCLGLWSLRKHLALFRACRRNLPRLRDFSSPDEFTMLGDGKQLGLLS